MLFFSASLAADLVILADQVDGFHALYRKEESIDLYPLVLFQGEIQILLRDLIDQLRPLPVGIIDAEQRLVGEIFIHRLLNLLRIPLPPDHEEIAVIIPDIPKEQHRKKDHPRSDPDDRIVLDAAADPGRDAPKNIGGVPGILDRRPETDDGKRTLPRESAILFPITLMTRVVTRVSITRDTLNFALYTVPEWEN